VVIDWEGHPTRTAAIALLVGCGILGAEWAGWLGPVSAYGVMLGTLFVVAGMAVLAHGPSPKRPHLLAALYPTIGIIAGVVQLHYLTDLRQGVDVLVVPLAAVAIIVIWVVVPPRVRARESSN